MKGQKDKTPAYRVPLCKDARKVIELAHPLARNGYIDQIRAALPPQQLLRALSIGQIS